MPTRTALFLTLAILLITASAASATEPDVKTDEDKTFYALGVALAGQVAAFNLSPKELELVKAGLTDTVLNKEKKVELQTMMPKVQQLAQSRAAAGALEEKKKGEAFLAKAATEEGTTKTASGLVYSEFKAGTGEHPKPTDKVKVHYQGTLIDGTVFDSSIQRGQPASFPLNGVIKCWTEGLQLMKVGGKSKLVCPADLAYGDRGSPPSIKPGATLIFGVELLEIEK